MPYGGNLSDTLYHLTSNTNAFDQIPDNEESANWLSQLSSEWENQEEAFLVVAEANTKKGPFSEITELF